jgi:Holliday junction resolvase RusA-like endonuclease
MKGKKVIFQHFIAQSPVSWKRQGGAGKFRWSDKKLQQEAKDTLAMEIKAAEPQLRPNGLARFGYRACFHIRHRADGDNLEKLLMDALQGIVWLDDEQVDEGSWTKKIVPGGPIDYRKLGKPVGLGIDLMIYEIDADVPGLNREIEPTDSIGE